MIEVPKVDRGPLDPKNITGKMLEKRNGLFRVGTSTGIIKDWLQRNAIQLSPGAEISDPIPENTTLLLRAIISKLSLFGGQGFKKCSCRKSHN